MERLFNVDWNKDTPLSPLLKERRFKVGISVDLWICDLMMFWFHFKDKGMDNDTASTSMAGLILMVRPKSVGRIRLRSSDFNDAPLIDPNYLSDAKGEDLEAFLDGFQKMLEIYESPSFQRMGCRVIEYDGLESKEEMARHLIQNALATIYHPVGTCKMGNLQKDGMAVCSERLMVKGFNNLRVADASIAPDLVAGNTQGMCYVIGCKAANMILQAWNR